MKQTFLLIIILSLLSACGPTQQQIEEAIHKTQVAAAEATAKVPTATTPPTNTPEPIKTIEPTKAPELSNAPIDEYEPQREKFYGAVKSVLIQQASIDSVKSVAFNKGILEVEVITTSTEKSSLPDDAYNAWMIIAIGITTNSEQVMEVLAGGKPFLFKLTTTTKNGEYRFVSTSNYELLYKVRQIADDPSVITQDLWIEGSNAHYE